jgi:hypothetical protein
MSSDEIFRLGPFPDLKFDPQVRDHLRQGVSSANVSSKEWYELRQFLTDLRSEGLEPDGRVGPVARSVGPTTWLIHQSNHIIELRIVRPGSAIVTAINRDVCSGISGPALDLVGR